jgi:hypothetical protein
VVQVALAVDVNVEKVRAEPAGAGCEKDASPNASDIDGSDCSVGLLQALVFLPTCSS